MQVRMILEERLNKHIYMRLMTGRIVGIWNRCLLVSKVVRYLTCQLWQIGACI